MLSEQIQVGLAKAAEVEDRLSHLESTLRQLRDKEQEAQDSARDRADAAFAEARRQHPNLSVHQIAALLDDQL